MSRPVSRSLREERIFMSLLSSKFLQFSLVICIVSCVILFYNFAGKKEDFLTKTREMHRVEKKADGLVIDQAAKHSDEYENDFHILFMFTKVTIHPELKSKLSQLLKTLFDHAEFEPHQILHLHFVTDDESKKVAQENSKPYLSHPKVHLQIHYHDAGTYAKQVYEIVKKMQEHFGNHNYYEDAIFFLSLAMHKILPSNIHRIVQLDLDLKILVNIKDLWEEFAYFKHSNLFGLSRENQPVYRHTFWKYRKENPGTNVGDPPPNGATGFNSGVIMLNLDKIRQSDLYNGFLQSDKIENLVKKYYFKGHLGDQDFFTILSLEHPELFYTLDCSWNKQLCEWWRSHGYKDIFDRYFLCENKVKILHGNCNTPFPDSEN